jgi:hypothetical protein
MIPRDSACAAAREYSSIETRRSSSISGRSPMISAA